MLSPNQCTAQQLQELSDFTHLATGPAGELYRALWQQEGQRLAVLVRIGGNDNSGQGQQLFDDELLALEQLGRNEDAKLKVAPEFYGKGECDDDRHFFVYKEVGGKTFVPGERLPEPAALALGWDLFRTLDIIHGVLHSAFRSLELSYLRQEEKATGRPMLRLPSAAAIEAISEEPSERQEMLRRQDLLRAAICLLAMLTGYTLDLHRGRLRDEALPILAQSDLSRGTVRLLAKLLHPNPDRRPTEADSVAGRLKGLHEFWQFPADALVQEAEQRLIRAEESEKRAERDELAASARDALDLARRRGAAGERYEAALSWAERLSPADGPFIRARALFDGRSYDLARQVFLEEMEWSEKPASLRRWSYLAWIGEEIPTAIFDVHRDALVNALSVVNGGDFLAGKARFERLAKSDEQLARAAGFRALQADCGLFLALAESQNVAGGAYIEALGRAIEALGALPDSEFVARLEVGYLKRQQQLEREFEKSKQLFEELKQSRTASTDEWKR